MHREKNVHFRYYGIPAVIMLISVIILIAFFSEKVFPFGDKILIYNDMQYQYLDFFMWFRNMLHGEDSLLYSFNMGMGGSTITLLAYYLASPLNILSYFVQPEHMAEFLTLLIPLKLILCGIMAYIYLEKRFAVLPFFEVIMAVSYGLMGYNVLQCTNIMWLDGVMTLPLIALGIYRLVWERKSAVYFFALAYGIISNWYIGYMLCIFAVMYLIFELVLFYGDKRALDLKHLIKKVIGFGIDSILAVGASCFLFLPQTLQMSRNGEGFDFSIFTPIFGFSFLDGFRDLFLEGDKLTWSEMSPPIYIGSFVLILVVLFFLSEKVSLLKKSLGAFFLLGMMFVFCFRPLNYIFTAFKIPSSHTYRYAFIFSFFMIVVAAMCLAEINEHLGDNIKKGLLILLTGLCLFDYVKPYSNREMAYLSGIIILLVGAALIMLDTKRKRMCVFAFAIIICCNITEFSQKLQMEFSTYTNSKEAYANYNETIQTSVNTIKENDSSFYRIDKTFTRPVSGGCNNESMAFGYSSISNYSSANNVKAAQLMKNIGYTGDTTLVTYTPILAMDALMGVKYIYSDKDIPGCNLVGNTEADGMGIYENPYALSLAYEIADAAETVEFGTNALENQELLYETILGKEIELYSWGENTVKDSDYNSYIEWNVAVNKSGPLYVYFSNGQDGMTLYVNGEYISSNTWYNNQVEYLGNYQQGDVVTVRIETGGHAFAEDYGIHTGTLNMNVFEEAIQKLKTNGLDITSMEDGLISAVSDSSDEREILLTIPYEEGWTIEINGESQTYHKALDAFIGIEIPKGKCEIEMHYTVPGLKLGFIITLISLLVFLGKRKIGIFKADKEKIAEQVESAKRLE